MKHALCQPISATNFDLMSLIFNTLFRKPNASRPPASFSLAFGSEKLAVPTCTAVAPTVRYSSTSSTVSMAQPDNRYPNRLDGFPYQPERNWLDGRAR